MALWCTPLQPMCQRRTSPAPRHWTARHTTPALKLLPGPLPRALSAARREALHPSPPSCPISLPWPPGTSPPPRRRAGALTVSAALALPGASAPCWGTCLRSPLRPPRGFAACLPPPAHPLTRPPGRARRGRPVCQSLRVSGKCFCSRLISSHSCGSVTRWQVSARARTPAWVCAAPAPRTPQSRGGFPDPHKGYEGHGTPAAQGGPWDAVAAWHILLLEIGRFL